jgi:type I restriction enzyme, S subunit
MSKSANEISPTGRIKVTLGEIARNISENEYNPKEKGLDHCVGLENLDPGSLKIRRWLPITPEMSFTRRFSKGQILFGKRRAYQKKVALADFDGICSSDILVIEAKKENFVPELLPFIIQDDRFFEYAVGTSSGSLSPRTKWKFIADYEIWLPTLGEQRRIATTLWAAEDCIVKGERFVGAAERAKQVLMRELFSKDKSQDRKDWKIVRLGDICKTCTGGTPSRNQREFFGGSIPWFKSGELGDSIVTSSEEKITSEGLENSNAKIFPKGTLLIALYGATTGKVGLLGIDASTNQAICAIFPNEKVNSKFLFYLLIQYRPSILLERCGAAQPNISQDIIRKMEISIPSLPEQRQIAGILTRCDETIAAARANVAAAKALKMKMIKEMLTPQVG